MTRGERWIHEFAAPLHFDDLISTKVSSFAGRVPRSGPGSERQAFVLDGGNTLAPNLSRSSRSSCQVTP